MALFRRLRCTPSTIGLTSHLIASSQSARSRGLDEATVSPAPQSQHYLSTFTSPAVGMATVPRIVRTAPHHIKSVRSLILPRDLATFTSLQVCKGLTRQDYRVVCVSCVHTWGALGAKMGVRPEGKRGGSGEHGSVLAQFVGKAKEQKQVTVATKGQ